jgi:hypothetical protein
MRRDFLIEHWIARLEGNAALRSLMNKDAGFIYPAQTQKPVAVPSIEYLTVSDRDTENFNESFVMVDLFIEGTRKANQAERLIRNLTHSDVSQIVDGERVWMRFQESREIEFPSDKKVTHRQIEFLFEAVRDEAA